jgi:hypothetical protein
MSRSSRCALMTRFAVTLPGIAECSKQCAYANVERYIHEKTAKRFRGKGFVLKPNENNRILSISAVPVVFRVGVRHSTATIQYTYTLSLAVIETIFLNTNLWCHWQNCWYLKDDAGLYLPYNLLITLGTVLACVKNKVNKEIRYSSAQSI